MISPWWLVPAFIAGTICGFLIYDIWGNKVLDRWWAEDQLKREQERQAYLASQAPVKIKKVWPDLSAEEVQALLRLSELSGQEFEGLIGQLLRERGFDVELVGGSGDQGIDIVARNETETVVVQCKCYSIHISIPPQTLRDFLGATHPYQPCRALFVTTSHLTRKAEEFAETTGIEVYSGRDTVRWLAEFGLLNSK